MDTYKKVIVGIVGASGSGKDTVADYLKHRYDALSLRFSDPIKDTLKMFFEKPSRDDQAWVAVEFKKRFGETVFHEPLRRSLEHANGVITLNGLRYLEDYEFLKRYDNSFLIYVTAPQELRWSRTARRGEKSDDDVTLEQFRAAEETLETERYIPELGTKSDFVIKNETTLEDLFHQTDEVMHKIWR